MFGGHLVFASPWILAFLGVLPVLWWLLRLTPPSPRIIAFPTLSLLHDLTQTERTPARTPWWLLLLRLLIAILVIMACAEPLIDPQAALPGTGAVLIAIDNDWAAARAWDTRHDALHRFIKEAERENRNVILLPTAPAANGEVLQLIGPLDAKAAKAAADHLAPVPWAADWKQAEALIGKLKHDKIAYGLWFNSGLGGFDAEKFYATLKSYGAFKESRVLSDPENPIYVLIPPKNGGEDVGFSVTRANVHDSAEAAVLALGDNGHVFARVPVSFAPGAPQASGTLDLPLAAHNEVTRLEIEGQSTAAATGLLDQDWQHRPIGVVGDRSEESVHSLLSGTFYIDRALKPFADIHIDGLNSLLEQNMSVLILTDSTPLNDGEIPKLTDWIKKGGVFVRFAGERLATGQNPHEMELLPVGLRTGDRAMGGTMSWATPQKLREFPSSSPFQGLASAPDVTISRQILAEPSADLAAKSWAMLEDGTPLVTAKTLGRGLSILFHVPARSEWSNLPLSGLFVEMLKRITDLGGGQSGNRTNFSSLAPQQILDAFGNEQTPGAIVKAINDADLAHIPISPEHPPGYYGSDAFRRALNLGPAINQPVAIKDMPTESYQPAQRENDLQPWLLAAALILLLGDFLISLRIRGMLDFNPRLRRTGTIALLLLAIPFSAHAANNEKAAIELTSKTYLAYLETGNATIDHMAQAGLTGLARMLQRRSSLDQIGVTGVDPNRDELVFFPLIYWPLTPAMAPLSPQAAQRVNDYLHHGGMILFDSGLGGGGALPAATMQSLLRGIDIPPLVRIPENHVLHRSFYLLDEFPGRFTNVDLWLEPEELATFDGVAAVIAGSGGWAAAWAIDENGRPLFPCTPGGEAQREFAYRFGINLVMYALTGNYKSDQLHAQALLQRLGK